MIIGSELWSCEVVAKGRGLEHIDIEVLFAVKDNPARTSLYNRSAYLCAFLQELQQRRGTRSHHGSHANVKSSPGIACNTSLQASRPESVHGRTRARRRGRSAAVRHHPPAGGQALVTVHPCLSMHCCMQKRGPHPVARHPRRILLTMLPLVALFGALGCKKVCNGAVPCSRMVHHEMSKSREDFVRSAAGPRLGCYSALQRTGNAASSSCLGTGSAASLAEVMPVW